MLFNFQYSSNFELENSNSNINLNSCTHSHTQFYYKTFDSNDKCIFDLAIYLRSSVFGNCCYMLLTLLRIINTRILTFFHSYSTSYEHPVFLGTKIAIFEHVSKILVWRKRCEFANTSRMHISYYAKYCFTLSRKKSLSIDRLR